MSPMAPQFKTHPVFRANNNENIKAQHHWYFLSVIDYWFMNFSLKLQKMHYDNKSST